MACKIRAMIVVFGASTDIGRRLSNDLASKGLDVRGVSRRHTGQFYADFDSGVGLKESLRGASVVVSCAHARYAEQILQVAPPSVRQIILTGSAWRYSNVPNERADLVRKAERLFIDSGRNGVMIHPTMIYGGNHENNIIRLLSAIRRLPMIPAPGGGRQIVQPIYIDDAVASLSAAVLQDWDGPNVVPVAGQPLSWREMVESCARSIECDRPIIPVPLLPALAFLVLLNALGVKSIDANMLRRFKEDVNVPLSEMKARLSQVPRSFSDGIAAAVANWRASGALA